MIGVSTADLINAQVEALFGDLCGHNDGAARIDPAENCLLERFARFTKLGDTANAKGLQNHGVVAIGKGVEDARVYAGRKLEYKYARVDAVVETHRVFALMRAVKPVAHDAVVADIGDRRIVDANERVKAHGALFAGARAGNGYAAKHDRDVVRVLVERIKQALVQVELGVGKGIAHGLLRAGEYDGLGAVLNQVGKRRRGVAHGVGAVQNHEAVVVGITLDDDVADTHPVTGAHIGAVDVHGLHHVELAEARDLGDALGEFLTGQGGGEAVAVLGRCDGAARGDEKDALHAGIPIVFAAAEAESFGSIVAQGVQCSNVLHHL